MSVRTAEICMAILLALCSIGLMFKSAELRIGWVFWLSAGMLLTCIATMYRWFKGVTPESKNLDPFMTKDTVLVVGISAGSILFLLTATHFVGIYIALFFFLLFYLRFIGHHSWPLTIALVICVPIMVFCLFEWALKIPLPKAITEEWFYPIYDLMYSI